MRSGDEVRSEIRKCFDLAERRALTVDSAGGVQVARHWQEREYSKSSRLLLRTDAMKKARDSLATRYVGEAGGSGQSKWTLRRRNVLSRAQCQRRLDADRSWVARS